MLIGEFPRNEKMQHFVASGAAPPSCCAGGCKVVFFFVKHKLREKTDENLKNWTFKIVLILAVFPDLCPAVVLLELKHTTQTTVHLPHTHPEKMRSYWFAEQLWLAPPLRWRGTSGGRMCGSLNCPWVPFQIPVDQLYWFKASLVPLSPNVSASTCPQITPPSLPFPDDLLLFGLLPPWGNTVINKKRASSSFFAIFLGPEKAREKYSRGRKREYLDTCQICLLCGGDLEESPVLQTSQRGSICLCVCVYMCIRIYIYSIYRSICLSVCLSFEEFC